MERLHPRQSEIIRAGRLRAGFSHQQVAFLLGVQIRQYQRLEYGERAIGKVNMELGLSLCRLLEIDPFLLVFGEDESDGQYAFL